MVLVNFPLRFDHSKKANRDLFASVFLHFGIVACEKSERLTFGLEFVLTSFFFLARDSSKTLHATMKAKSCDICWCDIEFFSCKIVLAPLNCEVWKFAM